MSTPITDAASIRGNMTLVETYAQLRDVASRLETDRATLMEALENMVAMVGTDNQPIFEAIEALSAARANFPTT